MQKEHFFVVPTISIMSKTVANDQSGHRHSVSKEAWQREEIEDGSLGSKTPNNAEERITTAICLGLVQSG